MIKYFWLKKNGAIQQLSEEKYRKIFNRISTTKEKTFVILTKAEIGFITDGSMPKTIWLKNKQLKELLRRIKGNERESSFDHSP